MSFKAHFSLDFPWDLKINRTDTSTFKERDFIGLVRVQRFFNVTTVMYASGKVMF